MRSKPELIAFEALQSAPKTIVDIGYAQLPNPDLKKDGATVFGVDILEKPSPYDTTFKIDLNTQKLPFEDGSIDAVTMGCTLAHVANPLRLLADINRILKPDGILVLSSPNPNYYWENCMNIFFGYFSTRVSKLKLEEHFYDFTRYNIRSCALVTGFTLRRETGAGFAIVKTPIRLNVERFPGIAYEIVYTMQKTGAPNGFGKARTDQGIETFETNLFG